MAMEFDEIVRQAGPWAAGLSLEQVRLKKATGGLVITFSAQQPITMEQRDILYGLLKRHFAGYALELVLPVVENESEPVRLAGAAPSTTLPESAFAAPRGPGAAKPSKGTTRSAVKPTAAGDVVYGKEIKRCAVLEMAELREDSGRVTVEGEITAMELRKLNGGSDKQLMLFSITDYTNTIQCKLFLENARARKVDSRLARIQKAGERLRVRGDCRPDQFSGELAIYPLDVNRLPAISREDTVEGGKRVELHLHTTMSSMDALTKVDAAIAAAARWGHKAIAITDHGVVQAFPDAAKAAKKAGIKPLFGVEGYLRPDCELLPLEGQTFVVFDLETTGLKAEQGHIIEIGAVKMKDGGVMGRFNTFVDPAGPIPPNIVALTGITDDMVKGAPCTEDALKAFKEFCGEGVLLCAHNAAFDVGFVRVHGDRYGIAFDQPYVDTLMLSRHLLLDMENHKLNTVCKRLSISLENHHRAVDDAEATALALIKLLDMIRDKGVRTLPAVVKDNVLTEGKKSKYKTNHIVILAKTQAGMKNLYRLVSFAHLDYFHSRPQIPRSLLSLYREGLILGSACEQGELYQAMVKGESEETIRNIADWYDYLEIQPLSNNAFMVREGIVRDDNALKDLNKRIVELGQALGKPVAATGDVHFFKPEDAMFRAIIMHEMGFADADNQAPLYFKTTGEMLNEFSYLGEELAHKVVVDWPNEIADSIETLKPYPDGTHAPRIENAEENLTNMAVGGAHALYGEQLPDVVQKRLDKELNSIINNGFASLYVVAQRLVEKSLGDGYLVGSRGSVGSSFVATMAGITEVNPLPPHYICPNCRHSEFDVDRRKYACGVDMPDKNCPKCGSAYQKAGYDIPFEVFLGFHGDKTPDIDLNFSGEYQPVAHKYTEEIFGKGRAFRAGTISAIQDKTVYGYVMKYLEEKGRKVSRAEIDRLCAGCSGVKRTTGQHPGGIVVVPKDRDIMEFTPIQYPADQKTKNTITTHFDFHALDDRLVKLDILGHDDPTALKMLKDLTGIDPRSIPLDDPETVRMYSSSEPLGVDLLALGGCDVGSLGIPEFGTGFVRQMLMDTRPTTMEELVRIAGLSHGTDVWLNNAQDLVLSKTATLSQVICTRDDIMNYLIAHGCEPSISFKTMESVRKGRGLTPEMEAAMAGQSIPAWFVDSCKKIKYMFPRAHAVAYVMMSFRIAYYKLHYPLAFYAVYYTVRADAFDVQPSLGGAEAVLSKIKAIEKKGKAASKLEKDLLTILEVVYEMNLRGIGLLPVDLYQSHATRFQIEDGKIRPPFSAVSGVGVNAAIAIADACKAGERFLSIEDFQLKTRANSAVVAALEEAGCFAGMGRTNQLSLF